MRSVSIGAMAVAVSAGSAFAGVANEFGTLGMDVVVEGSQAVPGVGGLAALGGLGLVGRRRGR